MPIDNPDFSVKDRTWIIAICLVIVALWTVMILTTREYALFKSSLRAHFILKDGTIDRDIATLVDRNILRGFNLYSVFLIGFIPVILQRLFRKLIYGLVVIVILFLPCVWYGNRVMHVAWKMVDWISVLHRSGP